LNNDEDEEHPYFRKKKGKALLWLNLCYLFRNKFVLKTPFFFFLPSASLVTQQK